jgi:hypothetical protein
MPADWIGEPLLVRLAETVGIWASLGGVFAPWHIRRIGRARIEIQREKTLWVARTEQEVEEIRLGRSIPIRGADGEIRLLPRSASLSAPTVVRQEAVSPDDSPEPTSIVQAAVTQTVLDGVRRDVNVARALLHAEDVLRDDPQPPPAATADRDWLLRWRDAAGQVSTEDLQALWGRVLAEEVKQPGSVSLRTIEFLRSLSRLEAERIAELSSCLLSDALFMAEGENRYPPGFSFGALLELQQLGLLAGLGNDLEVELKSQNRGTYSVPLLGQRKLLLLTHPDPSFVLHARLVKVTRIGKEVFELCRTGDNVEHIRAVGRTLQRGNVVVVLADYVRLENAQLRWTHPEPL